MSSETAQTFFAVACNHWGRGDSIAEAKRKMKQAGWHRHPSVAKKPITIMALSCPATQVDVFEGCGLEIKWPAGTSVLKWVEHM